MHQVENLHLDDDRVFVKFVVPRADKALFVLDDIEGPTERAHLEVFGSHASPQEGRGGRGWSEVRHGSLLNIIGALQALLHESGMLTPKEFPLFLAIVTYDSSADFWKDFPVQWQ